MGGGDKREGALEMILDFILFFCELRTLSAKLLISLIV